MSCLGHFTVGLQQGALKGPEKAKKYYLKHIYRASFHDSKSHMKDLQANMYWDVRLTQGAPKRHENAWKPFHPKYALA